jgi:hypothetical protein
MTIEEVQQLIDGQVYLFKYEDKTIKRMYRGIMTTKNNLTLHTQHYATLSTLEPTPAADAHHHSAPQRTTTAHHSARDGDCL